MLPGFQKSETHIQMCTRPCLPEEQVLKGHCHGSTVRLCKWGNRVLSLILGPRTSSTLPILIPSRHDASPGYTWDLAAACSYYLPTTLQRLDCWHPHSSSPVNITEEKPCAFYLHASWLHHRVAWHAFKILGLHTSSHFLK